MFGILSIVGGALIRRWQGSDVGKSIAAGRAKLAQLRKSAEYTRRLLGGVIGEDNHFVSAFETLSERLKIFAGNLQVNDDLQGIHCMLYVVLRTIGYVNLYCRSGYFFDK